MKAIAQDRYGSTDVLELQDVEEPVAGEGEVLVRVHAAGAGPDVWHFMTGKPYFARLMIGFRGPKERVRGWDAAGTVETVGAGVTGFEIGDEVMGRAPGSFAELAVAEADLLVYKPARLGFEEAAAVPVSAVTALQALRKAKVRPGHSVLVIGAGGGVGTNLVQIAKTFGATVTGVASTGKLELIRELGADDVIDYTREDFTDGSRRWDVIVDTAGRRPLRELRRALTPKGTLVIVGGDGGGNWTGGFFRGMLRGPLLSLFVGQTLGMVNAKQNQADLKTVADLIEDGSLTPVVDRTFDLVEAADAIRYLEQGHARGKVVITV
jgi:NADPH:quinone reductase-like Zn-dependent oxidoreductase